MAQPPEKSSEGVVEMGNTKGRLPEQNGETSGVVEMGDVTGIVKAETP